MSSLWSRKCDLNSFVNPGVYMGTHEVVLMLELPLGGLASHSEGSKNIPSQFMPLNTFRL